ncbi:aldose 1-epimerase [Urechidicola croceus]|uniref:Aldose epimerase n=1 Tax=Urechidicola croceus TaxID=1850246 RepID=A0A1D8P5Y5_9FLAO|nr:aldose 1-epimerase [Urechidicola croceus]AOW19981.1 aldose epimerase [Urechidicola croceus]
MKDIIELASPDKNSFAKIENGELISYLKNGEELIHQKGNPGWRSSDTEMFPVIGPTDSNNFKVSTPKGIAIQDQHGLLRELKYSVSSSNDTSAAFEKNYIANTVVKNSKFPNKSTEENLNWPYNFSFQKIYSLTNDSLKIEFKIESEVGMPFMLGYHPAFMLNGNLDEKVISDSTEVSIPKIIEGGSTAFPILNTNQVTLVKTEGQNIKIKTKGFNNFMLWTEVPNMLCIEPITEYPYVGEKMLNSQLFNSSKGAQKFSIYLNPFK